ncbi:Gfo/Idh/MocA family protein [Lederbergia wuyishanensis]|uniref:Dehydrogenase n=1 Tax=Lederbergia wuyishanensis TaxID=1347903 RepID=A0ABU0DA14_9BACI|nr:Gfo/Idh/MocA family oxidoreductase [Lederbergia wuyishanensis]MCJ8009926.1 Gfo/Idh/MocA family oxidoreductase [Lederbergia wuyishanensis]MDQ0345273.1 putative dehydrogenase [Lederbergia wuyishanensis]
MLKVGIVGLGTVGSRRVDQYSQMNQVKLVGVVDKQVEKPMEYTHIFGVKPFFSLEDLVIAENPDVIDVCLPPHKRKAAVIEAALLGKHVICQSPLASSEADAEEMINACEKAGVQLSVCNPLHFSPEYGKVRSLINHHSVGEVGTVRIIRDKYVDRFDYEKSNELLLQLLVNEIGWLQSIFGNVERIYAKGLKQQAELVNVLYVSLRFENGLIAHVNVNVIEGSSKDRLFLEVAGGKGVLSYRSEDAVPITATYYDKTPSKEHKAVNDPYLEGLKDIINNFHSNHQDGQTALLALKYGLAALQSKKNNEVITLLGRGAKV